MRTIAYVDGFNLYYRAIRQLHCKWLDLWALIDSTLPPQHTLDRIKYFTAPVHALPGNLDSPARQRVYLAALRAYRPGIEVIHGAFTVHAKCQRMLHPAGRLARKEILARRRHAYVAKVNCDVAAADTTWTDDPGPAVHVINTEEKGSDVNLAVHFLNDAWADRADCFVLCTNDSDLAEAARIVNAELGKKVLLLTPEGTRPSAHLVKHATARRVIRRASFANSILPDPIPGTQLRKPPAW